MDGEDGRGKAGAVPFRRVVVLLAERNPSFDYYLAPRLERAPGLAVELRELVTVPPADPAGAFAGALLIVCRYVDPTWMAAIRAARRRLAGLVWFVDDDMAALVRDRSVPFRYRRRVRALAVDPGPRLERSGARLWVSTPVLAARLARWRPRVLSPLAGAIDFAAYPSRGERERRIIITAHATAAHAAEQAWLAPVLQRALEACPEVEVEATHGPGSRASWPDHPRLRLVPQQPWPAYRADTAARARELLLVPRLPTPVNRARSGAKRIDAARMGAALLVSDRHAFAPTREERALGMAVPLDPEVWAHAIIALVRDPERRAALSALNRAEVERVVRDAPPLFRRERDGWVVAGPGG